METAGDTPGLSSSPDTLSAEAQIRLQNLDMEALDIALEPGDILAGDVDLRLSPLEQRPAYELDTLLANLQIDDDRFSYRNEDAGSDLDLTLDNMEGDIGDSDLDGRLTLDTRPRPPRVAGELHSDSLDIADLGVLIGAPQETEDEDRFNLPDTPLVGEGWHAVTADVRYR